jgi:hypothetical protein
MKNFQKKDGKAAQWFLNAIERENLQSGAKIRLTHQSGHTYISNPTHTNLVACGCKIIESGNDAPRSGKLGEWAIFELTPEMTAYIASVEADKAAARQAAADKANAYIMSVEANRAEIVRRAELRAESLTGGESNKTLRKIAHNVAASVVGAYGTAGMAIAFGVIRK